MTKTDVVHDGVADYLGRAEAAAREVLKAAGLPGSFGPFVRSDAGQWIELPAGWRTLGHKRLVGALPPEFQNGSLVSIVGLVGEDERPAVRDAANVIEAAHWLRQSRQQSSTEAEWGIKLAEAALIMNFERHGLHKAAGAGHRIELARQKGGLRRQEKAAAERSCREAIAAAILKEKPWLAKEPPQLAWAVRDELEASGVKKEDLPSHRKVREEMQNMLEA